MTGGRIEPSRGLRLFDPVALPVLALPVLALPVLALAAGCAGNEGDGRTEDEPRITPFVGAGVQIEFGGTVIHVDPWGQGDYSEALPADLILITDTPVDHLDPDLVATLREPGAPVVVPATPDEARDEGGRERLLRIEDPIVMHNGESRTLAGVGIEAVPMYDLIPGEPFHARGEGNGYILTLGEAGGDPVRIYVAGVTECTPEMREIRDVDIMFVPMNLPHGRMPPAAAAECVRTIGPSVVYPYHYRRQPIEAFVEALRDDPVDVRVHDWYPEP